MHALMWICDVTGLVCDFRAESTQKYDDDDETIDLL